MQVEIRKALEAKFASAIAQTNMREYYQARNIEWDEDAFDESWISFDNYDVYANGKLVGVLRFSFGDTTCYIRDLQIESVHQGLGIGKCCLTYAVNFAKKRSDKKLMLRVFSENPALNLYERFGFKKLSESNSLVEMELSFE